MELNINSLFNACASYYVLAEMCNDEIGSGKSFYDKYCAIREVIEMHDLGKQFAQYMEERIGNS